MSAIISIIPIVLLFILMLGFKMAGHKSALLTFICTVLIGLFVAPMLDMVPEAHASDNIYGLVWWSFVEGALKAIFPILIIILMAIYSYNILVESKKIEVIKSQFTSISEDKGVIVLILTWGFGGLLEGMAGFGTAVAIPAAILIGLGFKPMFSALVSLIANTVATSFGAVGVPVTTLCNEVAPGGSASAEAIQETSAFAVMQLSPLFILLPFIILMLTDKTAIMKNILLAFWTGIISLAVQFVSAYYLGAETPAILGSVAAIVAIIVYAKLFIHKQGATNASEQSATNNQQKEKQDIASGNAIPTNPLANENRSTHYSGMEIFRAWSVYLFILIFILLSGALCPPINAFLKTHLVSQVPIPVVGSTFRFGWISNAGFMLFLGATIGGLIQGLSLGKLMTVLSRTLVNMHKTILTIICLISLSSVMNYTGMIGSIAEGLVAITGGFYPFFAPLIGAIGTFVTGSDTSSNILFAKLQANVAGQLGMTGTENYFGIEGSETNWLVASNTTGATGGKMISPQSIAIATASCDMPGKDGEILRSALPYAIGYIIIGGLVVFFG